MDEELFSSWDTEEGDKRETTQREYSKDRRLKLIYSPPEITDPPAGGTVGVRFSHVTFLTKNFLDQQGIHYEPHELEDSPFGPGIRIKKDENQSS